MVVVELASLRATVVLALSLLCFDNPAAADSPPPLTVNMQRGPWKLTDITMQSLLNDGYSIISTETLMTLSSGMVIGFGAFNAQVGEAESAYLAYYLKKGPTLFRCTEERWGAQMVYCWSFSPAKGPINNVQQRDINPNPLVGQWSGFEIGGDSKMIPMTYAFTEGLHDDPGTMTTTDPGFLPPMSPPNSSSTFNVNYAITGNDVTVFRVDGNGSPIHFTVLSDSRIAIIYPSQTVSLIRVGQHP